jgi:hypothetical protein
VQIKFGCGLDSRIYGIFHSQDNISTFPYVDIRSIPMEREKITTQTENRHHCISDTPRSTHQISMKTRPDGLTYYQNFALIVYYYPGRSVRFHNSH